jgi:hypothetical protein
MPSTTRITAIVAAALVAAGGIAHLAIWDDRFRDLPSTIPGIDTVQKGFPVNAAVSLALAVALVALPRRRVVALGALGLQLGSIFALVDAREWTLLGWEERGYDAAARNVLILELVTSLVLGVLLWFQSKERSGITTAAEAPTGEPAAA